MTNPPNDRSIPSVATPAAPAAIPTPRAESAGQPLQAAARLTDPRGGDGSRVLGGEPVEGARGTAGSNDVMRYLGIIEDSVRKARKAMSMTGREPARDPAERGSPDGSAGSPRPTSASSQPRGSNALDV